MADPFSPQGVQDTISGPGRFVPNANQGGSNPFFSQLQQQQYQANQAALNRKQQQDLTTQGYGFQGNQAELNRGFQGTQADLERQNQLAQANIAAQASEYPYQLKQQRFDQLFPMLQSSQARVNASTAGPSAAGGSPEISVGGVYNPQQVQQQVNASRAANDQATATQQHAMQGQLAGRGYGANSPLLQALQQGAQNTNLATNVSNERTTRMNAAQQNAGQVLSTQQAREAQYASRQNEAIARGGQQVSQSNALLAAIAGLS